VYAITQAEQQGWAAARTLALFGAAVSLLAGFLAWELRHPEPLMRLGLLRARTLAVANVTSFLLTMTTLSTFLLLTLYMQQVLGFSAMETGLAFLAIAGTSMVWSTVGGRLVTHVGVRPVLVTGLAALSGALLYLTRISADGSYVEDLLPAFLVIALGLGFTFVPTSIAALTGIEPREAGLASGLITTTQQVGGALGIAVASTLAASRADDALAGGSTPAVAQVEGFQAAFGVSAAIAALALVVALALIRPAGHGAAAEQLDRAPVLDLAA
jgi:predicted MFS family arabinose efflux permease